MKKLTEKELKAVISMAKIKNKEWGKFLEELLEKKTEEWKNEFSKKYKKDN